MSDAENNEEINPLDELQLPKEAYKRASAARKLHETYETLQEQYKQERIALEKKFLVEKEKLYVERQAILTGEKEVPEVEGKFAEEEDSDEKGVPSFWLTVLTSHPSIGSLVTEEDVPALNALTNVTCEYADDFKTFTLRFEFDENDYFTNKVLTKTYHVSPDLLDEKAPQLENVETTAIEWKASKNLTVTEIKKKQKAKSGRNKGQVRTVTRTEPKPSFFHYFDEQSEEKDEDEEEEEKEDEDQEGAIKLTLDEDYDVAHIIRTALIPEAIVWFTGEAAEDMDFLDYGDEDDEDDEDDGDEEEDDEEEEGGADKPKIKFDAKSGFAAAGAPAAGGAAGEKPECKQN